MFEQFCAALMYEVQVFASEFDKRPGSAEYYQIERKNYS